MKKIALILCSLMLVICSACSSQQPAAHDLNMTDLAEKLKTSGAFEENIDVYKRQELSPISGI